MASNPAHIEISPSTDRRTLDLVLRVRQAAPTETWSLILGEYLHDSRSALDALTWELAHLEGKTPNHPQRVQFPLDDTESAFDKSLKDALSTIPPLYAERIREIQPFRGEPETNAFTWLRQLSNHDKHRALVACTINFDSDGTLDLVLEGDTPPEPDFLTVERLVEPPIPMTDGLILQRHTFSRPWRPGQAMGATSLTLQPIVKHPVLGTMGLRDVVERISAQVGVALEYVRYGTVPALNFRPHSVLKLKAPGSA